MKINLVSLAIAMTFASTEGRLRGMKTNFIPPLDNVGAPKHPHERFLAEAIEDPRQPQGTLPVGQAGAPKQPHERILAEAIEDPRHPNGAYNDPKTAGTVGAPKQPHERFLAENVDAPRQPNGADPKLGAERSLQTGPLMSADEVDAPRQPKDGYYPHGQAGAPKQPHERFLAGEVDAPQQPNQKEGYADEKPIEAPKQSNERFLQAGELMDKVDAPRQPKDGYSPLGAKRSTQEGPYGAPKHERSLASYGDDDSFTDDDSPN